MSKTDFISVMEAYVAERKKNETWLNGVENIFNGAWEAISQHNYEDLFINTLIKLMNDDKNWITFFLFEKDGKWFSYEGRDIACFGDLYDLIMEK